jgi:tetratricopeptide (TPR) repeat protein
MHKELPSGTLRRRAKMERGKEMTLSEIKSARNKGDYDAALKGCEDLLSRDADDLDALRIRATVLALMKRYREALADYQVVIGSGSRKIGDYYLAAETAYLLGEYKLGCGWLGRVLDIGAESDEDGFNSAAHFLSAYGLMKLGKYDQALDSLNSAEAIDSNISLPLPGESGVASAQQLRTEIIRRRH